MVRLTIQSGLCSRPPRVGPSNPAASATFFVFPRRFHRFFWRLLLHICSDGVQIRTTSHNSQSQVNLLEGFLRTDGTQCVEYILPKNLSLVHPLSAIVSGIRSLLEETTKNLFLFAWYTLRYPQIVCDQCSCTQTLQIGRASCRERV